MENDHEDCVIEADLSLFCRVYVYVYVYVYMCVCVYVCVCVLYVFAAREDIGGGV